MVSRAMAYEEKGCSITTAAVPEEDSTRGVESPQNADASPAKKAADEFSCIILHPSVGSLRKLQLSLHPSVGSFKRHGFPSITDVPKWRDPKHDDHRHTSYAMRQAPRSSSFALCFKETLKPLKPLDLPSTFP